MAKNRSKQVFPSAAVALLGRKLVASGVGIIHMKTHGPLQPCSFLQLPAERLVSCSLQTFPAAPAAPAGPAGPAVRGGRGRPGGCGLFGTPGGLDTRARQPALASTKKLLTYMVYRL